MVPISVVILSGGNSTRMGSAKARLQIHGVTFVEYIAEKLSQADEILFSVKYEEDFPEIDLPHITDVYPGCGPLAGIHSALTHARNPWIFVLACDTPFVTWDTVEQMYSYTVQSSDKNIDAVVPRECDGRLHAVCSLYHKNMLPLLNTMLDAGVYRVKKALEDANSYFVPTEEFDNYQMVFRNVNTLEEYKEICQ